MLTLVGEVLMAVAPHYVELVLQELDAVVGDLQREEEDRGVDPGIRQRIEHLHDVGGSVLPAPATDEDDDMGGLPDHAPDQPLQLLPLGLGHTAAGRPGGEEGDEGVGVGLEVLPPQQILQLVFCQLISLVQLREVDRDEALDDVHNMGAAELLVASVGEEALLHIQVTGHPVAQDLGEDVNVAQCPMTKLQQPYKIISQ